MKLIVLSVCSIALLISAITMLIVANRKKEVSKFFKCTTFEFAVIATFGLMPGHKFVGGWIILTCLCLISSWITYFRLPPKK